MYDEVQIACALLNAFGVRLTDNELASEIINEIHLRHDYLSSVINENNFNNRRALFRSIDGSEGFEHFPILTYEELHINSLGPYQVEQARSYFGEHVKRDGSFIIEVYEEPQIGVDLTRYNILATEPYLLRGKIQSRHQNRRVYFVNILIDNALEGRNKIIGYYCNCLVGNRTLGCCAHVMCIIWWARQQDIAPALPAGFLDAIFISDEEE